MIRQVTLDRANRKKDKSVSLTFVTQLEQSSNEFMEVDELLNNNGTIYFKTEGKITQKEIDAINVADLKTEGKSKSQRLRSVLYILWQQLETGNSFNDYYADTLESIIEHYKNKLT